MPMASSVERGTGLEIDHSLQSAARILGAGCRTSLTIDEE